MPGDTFGWFTLPGPLGTKLRVVVGDGKEWPLEGPAWEHVSVSTERRCPTWIEMEFIRQAFFEDDETVVQFSVPRAVHINLHEHCLHMWRPIGIEIPMPPKICV
jgi:hypothetical protein